MFTRHVVSRLQGGSTTRRCSSRVRVMFDDMHLSTPASAPPPRRSSASSSCWHDAVRDRTSGPIRWRRSMNVMLDAARVRSRCDLLGRVGLPRALGRALPARERVRPSRTRCSRSTIVVTREGRLVNLDRAARARRHASADQAQIDRRPARIACQRARLDQPLELRLPTAIMVWLVDTTTVRASKQPAPLDVPLPQPKKRRTPRRAHRVTRRSVTGARQPSTCDRSSVSSDVGSRRDSVNRAFVSRCSRTAVTAARRVDVTGRDVVHRVAGAQRQAALAELAVDRQLVVLLPRVGDAVHREHAAPVLPVLRELDALNRRVVVLHVERDDGAAARRRARCRPRSPAACCRFRTRRCRVRRSARCRRSSTARPTRRSSRSRCRSAPSSCPRRESSRSIALPQRLPRRLAFAPVQHVVRPGRRRSRRRRARRASASPF